MSPVTGPSKNKTKSVKKSSFLNRPTPAQPTLNVALAGLAFLTVTTHGGPLNRPAPPGPRFVFSVIASGLHRPTGIAIRDNKTLFFSEIPTPGINGANGGSNSVSRLDLRSSEITVLHSGEPEPVNLTVGRDQTLYWTCRTAGVVLEQNDDGETSVLLRGLTRPSGITVDRCENIYFTQIPTPGINGANGGFNSVNLAVGTNVVQLHSGEPEPTDIVVAKNGDLYWTCKTAGVILERSADDSQTRVLLNGLQKPVGIAVDSDAENLYFTEVPTPGINGASGGQNKIWQFNFKTATKTLVHSGDPEPTDIAVARNGNLYWTCSSAGVIVEGRRRSY